MKPIRAIYENGVFRPLDAVDLADRAEVLVEAVAGRPRSRDALLAAVRAELPRLREKYGVLDLVLFGSAARDEMGFESDVDFAVRLDASRTLFDLIDLAGDLTLLVGRTADVVLLESLKPAIRKRVETDGIAV